tara:strand:+ start:1813 stop:2169 length:357 start_codon:yes stop_codon:yes gene_type:complete
MQRSAVGRGRLEPAGSFVAAGGCKLGLGIPGAAGGLENAGFAEVVGSGAMEHTPVVPDHQVSRSPAMEVEARGLAGRFDQVVEERLSFRILHPRNPIGVSSRAQGFAAGDGMNLDQRT